MVVWVPLAFGAVMVTSIGRCSPIRPFWVGLPTVSLRASNVPSDFRCPITTTGEPTIGTPMI